MRWGLVPHWAKDFKVGFANINAKAEGIENLPAFREAFKWRPWTAITTVAATMTAKARATLHSATPLGAALGALAQETRLALFRLLVTAGPAGLRPGALGQLVGGAAKPIGEHSNGRSTGQEDPAGRRVEEVAQNNG